MGRTTAYCATGGSLKKLPSNPEGFKVEVVGNTLSVLGTLFAARHQRFHVRNDARRFAEASPIDHRILCIAGRGPFVLTGPNIILTLKIAVAAVTVVLIAAVIAVARGNYRLHGRLNLVFFTLTLMAVLGLELVVHLIAPEVFDYIKNDSELRRASSGICGSRYRPPSCCRPCCIPD